MKTKKLLMLGERALSVMLASVCLIIPANAQLSLKIRLSSPEHGVQEFTYEVPAPVEPSEPGDSVYQAGDVSFEMKYVKGGTFKMGAQSFLQDYPNYDVNAGSSNESSIHNVTLSDYYIGETEVTQGLYNAVMGNSPLNGISESANFPMGSVVWDSVVGTNSSEAAYTVRGITYYKNGFCYKLSQLVGGGRQFRLPTEAEWEYAAKGGSKFATWTSYSGSNTIDDVAWYFDNTSYGSDPREVKGKQPNALGLYDMSGNISEWCCDWSGDYSHEDQTDPVQESDFTQLRVLRGGCFRSEAKKCCVFFRHKYRPNQPSFIENGFRLAL